MVGVADASLISLALLALVDVVALVGGLVFTWRALKRLSRFAAIARRESLEVALCPVLARAELGCLAVEIASKPPTVPPPPIHRDGCLLEPGRARRIQPIHGLAHEIAS